jgi:hypothetical protein
VAERAVAVKPRGFGQTQRRDRWWIEPAAIFFGLSAFAIYATWAALQGQNYEFGPYLSPFYSPELFGGARSWFGPKPVWWPGWLPFSPAMLILWAPGGFRLTCYYYRGSYYKAFWADPPSCAVGEPRASYCGENAFPLIIQNIHRYFLYLAVAFLFLLASDVWRALWFANPATGQTSFGLGVGTFVLAINVVMLGGYAMGCHSMRHLLGGGKDEIGRAIFGRTGYNCVSCLNRNHMRWAWGSLFWVAFSDLYVRLCSMGVITDWRIL